MLYELIGGADLLYVADCKLASSENLNHIAVRGGRFVTVLPRGRAEDVAFRQRLHAAPARLGDLRDRLQGPRTVEQAVADAGATAWLMVAIEGQ